MGNNETIIKLEGDVCHLSAVEVKEKLLAGMTGAGPLVLDLSGINTFDLTLIQLLVAAQKSATENQTELKFSPEAKAGLADYAAALGVPRPEGADRSWPW